MGIGIDPAALLDVVIGLSFLFFLSATLCSALSEAVASVLRWRAKDLQKGIANLLGSGVVEDFYKDPRILALGKKKRFALFSGKRKTGGIRSGITTLKKVDRSQQNANPPVKDPPVAPEREKNQYWRNPSYLHGRTFAAVALDLFGELTTSELEKAGFTAEEIEAIEGMRLDGSLQTTSVRFNLMAAVVREVRGHANKDIERAQKALETKFNDTMDRVSGWYKRKAVVTIAVIGVIATVGLNIDTVHVAKVLANDQQLAGQIADVAAKDLEKIAGKQDACLAEKNAAEEKECREKVATEAKEELMEAGFPIGWSKQAFEETTDWDWASKFVGFLITVVAICLGAPFWYQALTRFVPLRASGPAIEDGSGSDGKQPPGDGTTPETAGSG